MYAFIDLLTSEDWIQCIEEVTVDIRAPSYRSDSHHTLYDLPSITLAGMTDIMKTMDSHLKYCAHPFSLNVAVTILPETKTEWLGFRQSGSILLCSKMGLSNGSHANKNAFNARVGIECHCRARRMLNYIGFHCWWSHAPHELVEEKNTPVQYNAELWF